jgi:hypothetical protein
MFATAKSAEVNFIYFLKKICYNTASEIKTKKIK